MGGFELILVFIGIVWTIASGVVQSKKKKAAQKQRAMMIAAEQEERGEPVEEEPEISVSVNPAPAAKRTVASLLEGSLADRFEAIRAMRLEMLRKQNAPESQPPAPPAPATSIPPVTPAAPPPPRTIPARKPVSEGSQGAEDAGHGPSMALESWKRTFRPNPVKSKLSEMMSSRSSLKAAFVLKELLDPPLALRRERD